MRATGLLNDAGISITHFHVTTLKPFNDMEIMDAIASSTYGAVTMENHTVVGGLGTIIAERMAGLCINKRLLNIGINDTFLHGASKEYLIKEYGLDAMALVRNVEFMTGQKIGITAGELSAARVAAVHSNAKPEAL